MNMIDPNVMNEQLREERKGRYQRKEAFQPVYEPPMVMEEEGVETEETQDTSEFREYNNPIHHEDEEILPGLYQSDIDSWKKQYGDIWVAEVAGQHFVYRALERYEYKEIVAVPNTDPFMREEMICEYCVLYPQGYNFAMMANQKAGIPSILAEMIMEHSGFTRKVDVRKL